MPTRNQFSAGPQLPELMGPPDPAKRKRTAIRAEVSSKAAALISPQAREKASQQVQMDKAKFELSNAQNQNKMFKEEVTNYKMLQELEQLTADSEAQQQGDQGQADQQRPQGTLEDDLAQMTPEQAISFDPDGEEFKQLLVVGGEKAIKILAEKRREWARNQTRDTGLYNQGSTKLFEETYSPQGLERRNLALSRGTRSPEAIDRLQFLRDQAQAESAYNAGYRPPQLPTMEPFKLSEGQTQYDQHGRPVATAPQVAPPLTPTDIEASRQRELDRTSREEISREGREPKKVSDLERRQTEAQIRKTEAEIRKLGQKEGGLTENEVIRSEATLRGDFDSLSSDFRKIRDSYSRIQAAAADPSAAGDLAIIFNYMKILDPGSVVRESEFATAENAAGVPDRIRNMWNRALEGQRIAWNRDDFVSKARQLFGSQEKIQERRVSQYKGIARRQSLDYRNIITETGEFEDQREKLLKRKAELEAKR